MTKPLLLHKEALTLAEVQATLKSLKKRDEDLSFRGNKTEEYVNQVTKLSKTKAQDLKKKLVELEIPRLKEDHIVKIVDLLPSTIAEIKIVLQGYTVTISNENLKKIVDTVTESQ